MFSPLLGHAGGFSWDEALLVMTPIAIVAGVLFLANQRAKRFGPDAPGADPQGTASAPDPSRDAGAAPADPTAGPTSDPMPRTTAGPSAGPTTDSTTGPAAERGGDPGPSRQ